MIGLFEDATLADTFLALRPGETVPEVLTAVDALRPDVAEQAGEPLGTLELASGRRAGNDDVVRFDDIGRIGQAVTATYSPTTVAALAEMTRSHRIAVRTGPVPVRGPTGDFLDRTFDWDIVAPSSVFHLGACWYIY